MKGERDGKGESDEERVRNRDEEVDTVQVFYQRDRQVISQNQSRLLFYNGD